MSNFIQYCPQDIFNGGQSKDGACPIKGFKVDSGGAGVVTTIVAGVTGKVIRLLSLDVYTAGAATDFNLQSGASFLLKSWIPAGVPAHWSEPVIGICDSETANPLRAQCTGAGATTYSGRYIEYTP